MRFRLLFLLVAVVLLIGLTTGLTTAEAAQKDVHVCHTLAGTWTYKLDCTVRDARSIRIRLDGSSKAYGVAWRLQCPQYSYLKIKRTLGPSQYYDIWINADKEYLAFDIMSFDTCHLELTVGKPPDVSFRSQVNSRGDQ